MAWPAAAHGLLAMCIRGKEASRDGGTPAPASSTARVLRAQARQGEDTMGLFAAVVGLESCLEHNSRAAMVAPWQAA